MPHKYMRDKPGAPTKWCRHCEQTLPIDSFCIRRSSPDGRNIYCKPCASRPERARAKQVSLLRARADRRAVLVQLKQQPCMDCEGSFPSVCMQFDHRDPSSKRQKVSDFGRGGTMEKFMAEVAKCDLVCANCHAIRTERRRRESLERSS